MSDGTPRFHTAEAALAYEQGRRDALREAADALEAQPAKLRAGYVATLRMYADEPWRMNTDPDQAVTSEHSERDATA